MQDNANAPDIHVGGYQSPFMRLFFGKFLASCTFGISVGMALCFIDKSINSPGSVNQIFDLSVCISAATLWNAWRV